jgi:hypothetical protein
MTSSIVDFFLFIVDFFRYPLIKKMAKADPMPSSPISYGPMCFFLSLNMLDYAMHSSFYGQSEPLSAYFHRRHLNPAIYFLVIEISLFLGGIFANVATIIACFRKEMSQKRRIADLSACALWITGLVLAIFFIVPGQMKIGATYGGEELNEEQTKALQDSVMFFSRLNIIAFLLQMVCHFFVWQDGQKIKEH